MAVGVVHRVLVLVFLGVVHRVLVLVFMGVVHLVDLVRGSSKMCDEGKDGTHLVRGRGGRRVTHKSTNLNSQVHGFPS